MNENYKKLKAEDNLKLIHESRHHRVIGYVGYYRENTTHVKHPS